MSIASLFRARWRLEMLEDPTQFVEGQFPPTEFEEGVSTNYAHVAGFGSEDPISQWVNGKLDTVQFTARFYAKTILDSVSNRIDTLKNFTRKDPQTRRPPPLLFTWGREISKQCVLTSLGGIRYDNIRIDGTIRGCTMPIQLVEYRKYETAVEELTGGESFVHVAKTDDTFESIALLYFARPEWGDLIRKRNVERVNLEPGDIIEIPEEWVLRTETVTPRSIPFLRKDEQTDNRRLMFDARHYTYISHVI